MSDAAKTKNGGSCGGGPCSCGTGPADTAGPGGHAVGVDPALKEQNLRHLRRIEGQVRGIVRMVEEERYCSDIITQIAAARESLQSVAKNLMRNHMKHCAAAAISKGPEEAEAMYDELLDLVGRMSK